MVSVILTDPFKITEGLKLQSLGILIRTTFDEFYCLKDQNYKFCHHECTETGVLHVIRSAQYPQQIEMLTSSILNTLFVIYKDVALQTEVIPVT